MSFFIIKIFITAILIVSISEIAKFNDRLGGIIGAMPITTFLILFWLYYENSSLEKISNHIRGINQANYIVNQSGEINYNWTYQE